jgi:signal transduction histidine kinase
MLVRQRVPSEERRQQYYLTIRRESDRLARLVENVLDIARIKDGRTEYRFEPLDTAGWLRDVAAEFQSMLETGDRRVELSIPDQLPSITADRQSLSTALHNLLDNAVKYSPGRGSVWLEAEPIDDEIVIRVRDAGVGIPRDEQARIFDRFYRGRQLADEVRGTGLGLSLVRHIVSTHDGTIGLASVPGEGTTFTMRLPVGARHAGPAKRPAAHTDEHPEGRLT